MKIVVKIFLLLIICVFSYKALLGICFWYREKTEHLGLSNDVLDAAADDILMGLVVFITVIVSAWIGRKSRR